MTTTQSLDKSLAKNSDLVAETLALKQENATLKELIASLQEQLDWFRRQVFGSKSERIVSSDDQLEFPGFASPEKEIEAQEIKGYTRKKQRQSTGEDTLTYPDTLPVESIVLDLKEEEKICPQTGQALVQIGEEVTRRLAFKPGNFFIKEWVRPKYASPSHPELGVQTADLPEGMFRKSKVDESLLAHIVTMKFADHLPLYRIQEILSREHIHLSRELLSNWVVHIGKNLSLLYEAMRERIFQSEVIFVDETPVKLLVKGKKKAHQSYMWVYCGGGGHDPPYRLFQFCFDRKHKHALQQLKGYRGFLHSDKFGAYETLSQEKNIHWCPCWTHIRRYFYEAQSGDQKFREYVLRKIRYLYMFERVARSRSDEERVKIRLEKEKPIIKELIKEVNKQLVHGKHLPKSNYRKALDYFCGLIPHLENYLSHGEAQIDNNVAERAIRPLAIGRKNWLFLGSTNGGKAAALLLSLVQTCRNLHINPREYLEDLFKNIMGSPASKIKDFLPDNWAKSKKIPIISS